MGGFSKSKSPSQNLATMPRDWFIARDGWNESNKKQNKAIAEEIWPLSKNCKAFKDISGIDHAWCGSSRAAACKSAGYMYPERNEGASRWIDDLEEFSYRVDWKKLGHIPKHATVVIKHPGYHVTGCDEETPITNKKFPGRGGNQSNAINVTMYNVADIVWVGMPKLSGAK